MEKIDCRTQRARTLTSKDYIFIISGIVILWYVNQYNHLMFHTTIELLTIAVGFSLMFISIGTSKVCDNSMLTYVGIIYGFVGFIDFFHALSYEGMVIYRDSLNVSVQLWIIARYFESIALVVSIYYTKRKININRIILINFIATMVLISLVFLFKVFPRCYIEGVGLTKVKVVSELIIIGMYILFIYLFRKNNNKISVKATNLLTYSLIFKIIAELNLCFAKDVHDLTNFSGHINKGISFYFMYKVLFLAIIVDPYNTIFNKLNKKADDLKKANVVIANKSIMYGKILDFLPSGIVKKENNKVVYVNRTFKEMFNIDFKNKISEEDPNFNDCKEINKICALNSLEEDNPSFRSKEYEFLTNDKKLITEISSLTINDDGTESSIFVIKDIGDKKKAEKVMEKLKEKEKEENLKSEFFANISHELRTPINVIYSALQMEKIFLKSDDIERIKKYNLIINQNCLRLIRIINNIIDSTKIEAGFMKPKFSINNIVRLVENITQSVISYADHKNINVVFDTNEEEIYVLCDSDYIERILLNLLANAIKYGKKGGNIEVSLSTEESGKVMITVEDDGIGIPDGKKGKVFNRFEKVDKSINRANEGSGIGLSIVKALVEIQRGAIWVESKLGEGSKFYIKFPIVEGLDEVCATKEDSINSQKNNIIEKINIEFSDIYF
ncbi:PAS domain-containing sensor histidine kinase [Clostridium sediminicola]|uniref:MASE3 domain-containing sensor histidine kinase n=1 Tax=Clostridium sediminicola TaxID=3114879 RepID=UPI0031F1FBDF